MLDLKSKYPDFYRFYGRRVAKKLSNQSIESIDYYFKSKSFDEEVINNFNERKLRKVDKKFQKIVLEVGFGNGEFLINQSNLNNQTSISISKAYKILNLDVSKKITKDDVNKAYIKIQKKIHPDISPETSILSSIVNEAKDIVLNDIS